MTSRQHNVFVRQAQQSDEVVISQHLTESNRESTKYRGSIEAPQSLSHIVSFVGGFGESVFGSITVGEVRPGHWHISHVFVEPDARETGIGDALVRHVIAALRQRQAIWISAQALPGDRAMKNLFERHGLVAQTITVGKSLNDPSTEVDASQ